MPWDEELSESFPKYNPHEPGNLRQDILDELEDHLSMAVARERALGEDDGDGEVWQRVLDRFGNPVQVARRLWFDAMKEEVMKDRLVMGVLMVLIAVVGVLSYLGFNQSRQTSEALLAVVDRMSEAGREIMPTTTIEVRRGTESGPPAEGVGVELRGKVFGTEDIHSLNGTTNSLGRVQFGPISMGSYTLTLHDPKSGLETFRQNVAVFGTTDQQVTRVVAPDADTVNLEIHFDLPPDLQDFPGVLVLHLNSSTESDESADVWNSSSSWAIPVDGENSSCYRLTSVSTLSRPTRQYNLNWGRYASYRLVLSGLAPPPVSAVVLDRVAKEPESGGYRLEWDVSETPRLLLPRVPVTVVDWDLCILSTSPDDQRQLKIPANDN